MDHVAALPYLAAAVPPRRRTDVLSWVVRPLRLHIRALLALNVAYFGFVILRATYKGLNRALQRTLLETVDAAFSPSGALGPLVRSYTDGQLLSAIGWTFVVNLLLGSLVALTVPSLVVPFGGRNRPLPSGAVGDHVLTESNTRVHRQHVRSRAAAAAPKRTSSACRVCGSSLKPER